MICCCQLCVDGEAGQIIAAPTRGQQSNITIVNSLYQLHTAVTKALAPFDNLPSDAQSILYHSLQGVIELMKEAVRPLVTSISAAIEAILLTMHDENFNLYVVLTQNVDESVYCKYCHCHDVLANFLVLCRVMQARDAKQYWR